MSANETQVDGTHYNKFGEYQHWDMVHYFHLDYYQGQITKYVMRWKDKNGLKDLEKARHFLDKYIELQLQGTGRPPPDEMTRLDKSPRPVEVYSRPAADAGQTPMVISGWTIEGYFADMTQNYKCKECGTYYRKRTVEEAQVEHGVCAGRGYVAQAA